MGQLGIESARLDHLGIVAGLYWEIGVAEAAGRMAREVARQQVVEVDQLVCTSAIRCSNGVVCPASQATTKASSPSAVRTAATLRS
jgi:hypothetical protein